MPNHTPAVCCLGQGTKSESDSWLTFARRTNQEFKLHTDELLADIAKTGIIGYQRIITSPAEFTGLGDRLRKHGLRMNCAAGFTGLPPAHNVKLNKLKLS